VHAMHDATEGGFVAALNELAGASKLGFRIDWDNIPISNEVLVLKEHFGLSDEQVLAMSSTGMILAAVEPQVQERVKATLSRNGLSASFIGEFTESKKRILIRNSKETPFPQVADDPYTLLLTAKATS